MKTIHFCIFVFLFGSTASCTQAQSNITTAPYHQQPTDPEAIIVGNKFKLYSEILGKERELYISLPPQYNEHIQDYPVIFVLEAEYLFEATQTIAKYMAARSKMPESIIVGIANGQFDKRHEFNYERWNGIPDKTLEFFSQELIPYIQSNYRANAHRTIIGLSPSTGFLYQAFLRQPGMFKGYIALSAHLEWDRVQGTKIIDEIMAKNNVADYPKSTFYLGRAESDFSGYAGTKEAYDDAIYKLENYTPDNVKIKVDILKDDEHYLMALAGIRSGIEAIYPNSLWRNPGVTGWTKNENYAQSYYKEYYDKLSSIYGFEIYPVENAHSYGFSIAGNIYAAQKWGEYQQVKKLAQLGIQYFPNSAYMRMALAESYQREGQMTLAMAEGEKAVELAKLYTTDELDDYTKRFEALKD